MTLWLVTGGGLLLGFLLGLRGIGRIVFRGRLVAGLRGMVGGGAVLTLSAITGLVGVNFQTYHALTLERPVARLSIARKAPQTYFVTLTEAETGERRSFTLLGDQWQVDARVLRFHPWANILGFNAVYRLDRISGRYAALEAERTRPRSVHALSPEPGLPLAEAARNPLVAQADLIDTHYGNATYLPLADGAEFDLTISQYSLVARPANAAATAAVAAWR